VIRGTTTFSPSERAANDRMVVLLVAVVWKEYKFPNFVSGMKQKYT